MGMVRTVNRTIQAMLKLAVTLENMPFWWPPSFIPWSEQEERDRSEIKGDRCVVRWVKWGRATKTSGRRIEGKVIQ